MAGVSEGNLSTHFINFNQYIFKILFGVIHLSLFMSEQIDQQDCGQITNRRKLQTMVMNTTEIYLNCHSFYQKLRHNRKKSDTRVSYACHDGTTNSKFHKKNLQKRITNLPKLQANKTPQSRKTSGLKDPMVLAQTTNLGKNRQCSHTVDSVHMINPLQCTTTVQPITSTYLPV